MKPQSSPSRAAEPSVYTVEIEHWTACIAGSRHRSVEAIIETGRLLVSAKAAIPRGAFGRMIATGLPFTSRTAQRLIAIAEDERIATHGPFLPPSWRTLYELTRLTNVTFEARIADGTIRPDMQRRDIALAVKQERRTAREREFGKKQLGAPDGKFGVIVEDFEWDFVTWSERGRDRVAENHYPVSRDAHTAQEIVERTKDRFACAADIRIAAATSSLPWVSLPPKTFKNSRVFRSSVICRRPVFSAMCNTQKRVENYSFLSRGIAGVGACGRCCGSAAARPAVGTGGAHAITHRQCPGCQTHKSWMHELVESTLQQTR